MTLASLLLKNHKKIAENSLLKSSSFCCTSSPGLFLLLFYSAVELLLPSSSLHHSPLATMKPSRGKLPLPIITVVICAFAIIALLYTQRITSPSPNSILRFKSCSRKKHTPNSSKSLPLAASCCMCHLAPHHQSVLILIYIQSAAVNRWQGWKEWSGRLRSRRQVWFWPGRVQYC